MKKLLDHLPESMRYAGKTEVLHDSFLQNQLLSIEDMSNNTKHLSNEELQSLLADDFVFKQSETRVGLFAVELDDMKLETFTSLRKVFPSKEYRLVLQRLQARKNRKEKRNQISKIVAQNERLQAVNEKLRAILKAREL